MGSRLLLEIAKELRAGGKCNRTECGTEPTAEVTYLQRGSLPPCMPLSKW